MAKISWVIAIIFACALIYFIYLNRAHSKIQEAIIVTIAGFITVVFGIVLFSPESNELNKNISSVFFVSLTEKKPIFLNAPVLLRYSLDQGIVWGDLERENPSEAAKIMEKIPDDCSVLAELQAIAVIQYLTRSYHSDWDKKQIKKVLPGATTITGQSLSKNPKNKQIYTPEKLMNIFKSNRFHNSLTRPFQLTLPKGTTIEYLPLDEKTKSIQIKLSKKYAFESTITFRFSSYMAGLGKVATYVGLTEPTNVWNVNWDDQKSFGTVAINIDCDAKFFSLMSGNPEVQSYKKWLGNLFDNLYEEFDWEVCNQAMKEYNEELANQKIVSDLGRGFEQKPTTNPNQAISKEAEKNSKNNK